MARGRMISKTLGTSSKKFARLRTEHRDVGLFAQALYPLLVVCSDDFGRQHGDAFTVKHSVWPTAPDDEATFDLALQAMHAVNLIVRYEVGGTTYIQIVDFDGHQSGLHKRTSSRYPDVPGTSGKSPEPPEIPGQENVTEQNVTEKSDRARGAHGRSDGAMAGSLPKDHLDHVECNTTYTICVHARVHAKLKNSLAARYDGDRDQADAALRKWYPNALAGLPAATVMGDAFKFWQVLFDEQFATAPATKTGAVVRAFLCRDHQPPCKDAVEHTTKNRDARFTIPAAKAAGE